MCVCVCVHHCARVCVFGSVFCVGGFGLAWGELVGVVSEYVQDRPSSLAAATICRLDGLFASLFVGWPVCLFVCAVVCLFCLFFVCLFVCLFDCVFCSWVSGQRGWRGASSESVSESASQSVSHCIN